MNREDFSIILQAVLDSKSEDGIRDSLKKLNETIGGLTIKIDPKSITAIGEAMREAVKEIKVVNETIVREHKKAKEAIEKDKIEFVDLKLTKKQMEAVSKQVEQTFKNLNISKNDITKEAFGGLSRVYAEVAKNGYATEESLSGTIALLDELAQKSKVNIQQLKKQQIDTQKEMGQQYTDVYNSLLALKDGKKNAKVNMSDDIKGVEGFKEAMKGIVTVVESGGITLDELQREMVNAGVVAKNVGEMQLQDFAEHLRDCVNQARELKKVNLSNVKFEMPSFEDTVTKDLAQGLQALRAEIGEITQDIGNQFKKIGDLTKIDTFKVMSEDGEQLVRVVEQYSDDMGNVQTITKVLNEDMTELLDISEKITNSKEKERDILRRISEFAKRNNIKDAEHLIGLKEKEIAKLEEQEKIVTSMTSKINKINDKTTGLMQNAVGFKEDKQSNDIINQTNAIKKAQTEMQKLVQSGRAVSKEELSNLDKQIVGQMRQLEIFERKYQRIAEVNKLEQKSNNDNQQKIQFYIQQQKYLDEAYQKLSKIESSEFYKGEDVDFSAYEKLESVIDGLLLNNKKLSQDQKTSIAEIKLELERYIGAQQEAISNNKQMADSIEKAHAEAVKMASALVQIDGKKSSLDIASNNKEHDAVKLEQLKMAYDELATKIKTASISTEQFRLEMAKLENESKQFKSTMKNVLKETNTFADSLKKFSAMYGIYEMLQLVNRAGRDMINTVVELDKALVEVNKVADIPNMDKFIEQSYQLGEQIGVTGKSIVEGVGEFARMGKTIEESLDLSRVANEMVLVGDGIKDVADASGVLQSALALFEKDGYDARNVLDLINQTANKTGATFEAVAEIVRRSSTLGLSGSSLEEIIALGAGLFEITRNAEVSATALNMINQRLMGLNDEGEYSVELVSQLGDELKKYTGVEVFGDDGQLRSTFDILKDINGVWKDLDKNMQIATSTLVGNNRHAKSFIAIMENFDTVNKSITESGFAEGSSQKELEAYMESLNGALIQLKSAWEQLAVTTINSGFVEQIIRGTTEVIKFVDACGGLIPVLTTIVGLITIVKSAQIVGWIGGLVKAVAGLGTTITAISAGTATLAGTLTVLTGGIGLAIVAISGLVMGLNYMSKEEERAKQKLVELKGELSSMASTSKQIDTLADSFDNLRDKSDLSDSENEEFTNIQNQLKELLPELRGYYDEFGNFVVTEKQSLNELADAYRESMVEKRRETIDQSLEIGDYALERAKDNIDKLIAYQEKLTKMASEDIYVLDPSYNKSNQTSAQWAEDLSKDMSKNLGEAKQALLDVISTTEAWSYKSEEARERISNAIENMGYEDLSKSMDTAKEDADGLANSLSKIANPTEYVANKNRELAETREQEAKAQELQALTADQLQKKQEEEIERTLELNEAIQTLSEGKALSRSVTESLIQKYPQLAEQLEVVEGGYKLNSQALEVLRDESIRTAEQRRIDEINATNAVIAEAKKRIAVYQQELEVMRLVASARAQNAISSMLTPHKFIDPFGDRGNDEVEKKIQQERDFIAEMEQSLNKLKSSEKVFNAMTSAVPSADKKKKEKKGKSLEKQIKEELDKATKAIQVGRDRIDKEIDILQEKINLNKLKGMDTDKLDEDMAKLLKLRKEATEVENQQYRALQKKFKDTESQATLEKLIADNSKVWFADRMNMMNQETSVIEEKLELSQRYYELEEEELKKQIELTGELSEKGIDLENKKTDKIKEIQTQLSDFLDVLRERGYGEESVLVQKYQDLWDEYDGKRRESELKSMQLRYDLRRKELEDIQRINNLQQMITKEDSDEWWKFEDNSLSNILSHQKLIAEQIQELRDKNYEETSDEIQELLKEWWKYEEDRIEMALKSAEKRRKTELEALKKQQKELQDLNTQLSDGQKAINDLISLTMDMIKKEMELKKKGIQEEINGYKKVIDEKKKALRDEKDEKDYQKSLKEKEDKIAKTEQRIQELSKDTSAKGTAERLKLEEELLKLKEELQEIQDDKLLENQENLLDEEFKKFEETKDKELKEIEDFLSKEGKLREEAIKLIESKNKELYNKLMEYNELYGNKTREEVDKVWSDAYTTLEHFNDGQIKVDDTLGKIVVKMSDLKEELKDVAELMDKISNMDDSDYLPPDIEIGKPPTGNGGDGGDTGKDERAKRRDEVIAKMSANSARWSNADSKERKQLEEENKRLAKEIGAWKSQSDGCWYVKINGKDYNVNKGQGIGVRHSGVDYKDPKTGSPFVGGKALLKSNEEFNKLLHGELVINSSQMDTFMKNTLPSITGTKGSSVEVQKLVEINIDGNASDDTVDKLRNMAEEISDLAIQKLNKVMSSRGHTRDIKGMSI